MNRYITLILVLLLTVSTQAQKKISREYHNVSLSDALRQLSEQQTGYTIYFLYNELEDFRITTTVKNKHLPEAIQQMIGFYPIRVTTSTEEDGKKIFVECIHKTDLHLTGTIIDEQGQPVAYANIAILNPADSTLLCGGVSNESGVFVIPIDQQNIIARISYVGYKTVYKQCNNMELGTIRIQPETQTLKGVTVKGQRLLYTATNNGLKVTVQGTPLEQFGSVTDMLTHLPLMMSNGEIAGHGKPEIYINNKKIRDIQELDRLRADEILSAEIITNPGAEYGAEVTSVIRLKTIRKSGEGWSGNFSAAYRQGEQWYGNLNSALNYRTRNGMDFFAKGYLTENNSLTTNDGQEQLVASNTWDYKINNRTHTRQIYYFADFGWNWEINEHHSLGFTYTPSNLIGNNKQHSEQDEQVWRDGIIIDEGHTIYNKKDNSQMSHSVNAYYVGEVGEWEIDFNTDLYNEHNNSESEGITNSMISATSTSQTKDLLLAEKLTITAPMPIGSLSFGEEISAVDRSSDFKQSGFSADNQIHQHTTIWSLYANYNLKVKKCSFSVGFRWQNEHNCYDLNGKRSKEFSPNYHVLIPRASVSYTSGGWMNTIAFNSSRVNPPYYLLSSTISYISKNEYESGNPFLMPQVHNSISWNSRWKWLYASLAYHYVENAYTSFHSAYDDANHPGVRLSDWRTIPTMRYFWLTLNVSPKIGIWQINYTFTAYNSNNDLESIGITTNYHGIHTDFNLDNNFSLPRQWLLNVQASIIPYNKFNYGRSKTRGSVNVRLSKQLLKDKNLSIAVLARDIFHTNKFIDTMYNGISYCSERNYYADLRRVGIDISWKFNATRSRYKGSHAGQSERSRL